MSSRIVDDQPLVQTTATDGEALSVTVCDLVSRATDTSIRDLPPLANAIDPDALDAVFDGRSTEDRSPSSTPTTTWSSVRTGPSRYTTWVH